jgi:thioredoxin-like negative regulator of GroEL
MSIPTITVVRAPACHFCADAREALIGLGHEVSIRVEYVEVDSDAGMALVGSFRPAMFPLVLVDGALFSQGRLPRRKLRAMLASRQAVSAR